MSEIPVRRVCVVGAGMSGLVALKSCLEAGLDATCYELTDEIGGIWKFRDYSMKGVGSVMMSTTSITSKEMSAFSDFPPEKHNANYMHHSCIQDYLEKYADAFRLRPHVKTRHEVVKVYPTIDYNTTGQWKVKIKNTSVFCEEIKETEEIFDGVMVCTGCFVYPNVPKFSGLDEFDGKIIHTHKYKTYQGLENDRCLVIGMGSSGTNVAVELARIGKHIPVHLSTRTGTWIIPRVADNGLPFDILYARRYLHYLFSKVLPLSVTNNFFEGKLNYKMDHGLYKIKPAYRFVERNATVEDDLAPRIITGTIAIRGDVDHFTRGGVYFKGDETTEHPIDTVILATGYIFKTPCLDENLVQINEQHVNLYQFVFPPNMKHRTLALVGVIQPNGAIFPVAEMQSRWIVKVFKNECRLPPNDEMDKMVAAHHRIGRVNPFETDWLMYLDTLATYINCRPNFKQMALRDPKLWHTLLFGPCVPYQYRLVGPNAWKGARNAILSVHERVQCPLTTRAPSSHITNPMPLYIIALFAVVVLFLYTVLF